jgi:hypothetical protein
MKKWQPILGAIALAASMAFAQQDVNRTEKTSVKTETDANGVQTTRETKTVTETQYVDRLQTAYRAAKIPQTKIDRLVELDRKIFEARKTGGHEDQIRVWVQEQKRILDEPEARQVIVYLHEHPVTIASPPAYFISTWEAPEFRSIWNVDVGGGSFSATGGERVHTGSSTDVNVNRSNTSTDVNRNTTTNPSGSTSVSPDNTTGNQSNSTGMTGTSGSSTGNTGASATGTSGQSSTGSNTSGAGTGSSSSGSTNND